MFSNLLDNNYFCLKSCSGSVKDLIQMDKVRDKEMENFMHVASRKEIKAE